MLLTLVSFFLQKFAVPFLLNCCKFFQETREKRETLFKMKFVIGLFSSIIHGQSRFIRFSNFKLSCYRFLAKLSFLRKFIVNHFSWRHVVPKLSSYMTNTKNKKNTREFLKTVGNKLEWIFRPYVQGLSSEIQKIWRRKNLQQDKINKTKVHEYFEWIFRPYVQGLSSEIQKIWRRKNLQQDKINKTKVQNFSKIVPASLPQRNSTRTSSSLFIALIWIAGG